jgi:hypothetical protein
MEEEGTLPLLQ